MPLLSRFGLLVSLLLSAATPLHAQTGGSPVTPNTLPPGTGKDIVAVACTQCHGLGTIVQLHEAPAGWKLHVYDMVLRGAQITPAEADTVINYLANNFGPAPMQPSAVPITLPGNGEGRDLVTARCTVCHDLARITAVKRRQDDWNAVVIDMLAHGATATPEEAKTIAAYLDAQFGEK
jgi:cytochrome c5